jgi:hypothetical protein
MLQGKQYADVMRMRADLLGEDPNVLAELQHLYKQWWSYLRMYNPKPPELFQSVGPVHGQLATWFLAVLRGPSLDFANELQRRTQELLQAALTVDQQYEAATVRPIVIGWSLGSVPGDYDYSRPVVFAEDPADANVQLAYSGLVVHLVNLGKESSPWPELPATAVLWRCGGIAEGLLPKEYLLATLQDLTAQVKVMLPGRLHSDLIGYWEEFTRMRNGFTHVAPRVGEYSFSDLDGKITNHDDLRLCLSGITYFVAESIRSALADPDQDHYRTGMLNAIRGELSYLSDMTE